MLLEKRDLGGEGRQWHMICMIHDDDENPIMHRKFDFRVGSIKAVKDMMLALIKQSLLDAGQVEEKSIFAFALPREKEQGRTILMAEEAIQLKDRYSDKSILELEDPKEAFVQGWGIEAQQKLAS